ncbi:hypothetical protein VTK26DRAFT_450 [Humicola hyalothermophila]
MLHPRRILPGHLRDRLARDLAGGREKVLLAVAQALRRGGRPAADGPAARHVGLGSGDGGGFGLGNGAALGGLLGELFLGRELRFHGNNEYNDDNSGAGCGLWSGLGEEDGLLLVVVLVSVRVGEVLVLSLCLCGDGSFGGWRRWWWYSDAAGSGFVVVGSLRDHRWNRST